MTGSTESGELTQLFHRIQNCRDDKACAELWEIFYERMVVFARKRISAGNQRVADEEDIALSAMKSFFRAAEAGRFRSLSGRDELWRILFTVVARKAQAFQQRQAALKRGEGRVRGDSVFASQAKGKSNGFDTIEDPGTPERFVDELMGECRERIDALPDETLRTIAVKRMEGYEVSEIAMQLDVSIATIKRKLARIRGLWAEDAPHLCYDRIIVARVSDAKKPAVD